MKSFFKFMFASMVGFILTLVIFFFIVMGIVGVAVASATSDTVTVKEKTVLTLDFGNGIVDRAGNNPFDQINFPSLKSKKALGLNQILKGLEKAKNDDKIKGIYINTVGINAGVATIEEIRNALIDFKTSGKFIISYSDIYTQGSYYLSSISDKIYLNPQGFVDFKGLSAQVMFYKDALEKVGVSPVIVRGKNNKFKSAVEPFMLNKMSDANREQTLTYMGSIWNHFMKGISETRGVSVEELNKYADEMAISSAEDALKYKLVDALKYYDEVSAELKEKTETKENKKINFLAISSYSKEDKKEIALPSKKDKIAVVYASGEIQMGKGSSKVIGSEGTSEAIRKARKDTTVKAIVLRVNSPGGSALASEVIWREMILAKAEKPIVVSMGDVAASGGYYISAPANKIFASPTTITGSIGVFGLMWNVTDLAKEIGINTSVVKTNEHSDFGSMTRKMTDAEYAVIQKGVEETYDTFLQHVAEGRNKTKEDIDAIGQGRVWSGVNAIENGLIDEFGGLNDAVKYAKELAKLEDYKLVEYPILQDPVQELIKELGNNVKAQIVEDELGETYKHYNRINQLMKIEGVQARMPYFVDIK